MCNVPGLTFWWYLYGGGVGGFGLSLLRWLGLVGSLARGPRGPVFLPSFRGALEAYGADPSASARPRGGRGRRRVTCVPTGHTLAAALRRIHHLCSPGCAPSTPFSDPHSLQRLARGPSSRPPRRLGLRDLKKLLRETVSQRRDLPRRHSQPACPSSPSPRPARRGRRGASARAA